MCSESMFTDFCIPYSNGFTCVYDVQMTPMCKQLTPGSKIITMPKSAFWLRLKQNEPNKQTKKMLFVCSQKWNCQSPEELQVSPFSPYLKWYHQPHRNWSQRITLISHSGLLSCIHLSCQLYFQNVSWIHPLLFTWSTVQAVINLPRRVRQALICLMFHLCSSPSPHPLFSAQTPEYP